jgi:hypothetical protein
VDSTRTCIGQLALRFRPDPRHLERADPLMWRGVMRGGYCPQIRFSA